VGKSRLYPVIIGEHGTGKISLIKLAVNGMDEPKGIVYVDVDINDDSGVDTAEMMRIALGWSPDRAIDSSKRNYSSSLLVNIT
jgi:KaiC/GvpD/RAD55 family RecA-like ATPase